MLPHQSNHRRRAIIAHTNIRQILTHHLVCFPGFECIFSLLRIPSATTGDTAASRSRGSVQYEYLCTCSVLISFVCAFHSTSDPTCVSRLHKHHDYNHVYSIFSASGSRARQSSCPSSSNLCPCTPESRQCLRSAVYPVTQARSTVSDQSHEHLPSSATSSTPASYSTSRLGLSKRVTSPFTTSTSSSCAYIEFVRQLLWPFCCPKYRTRPVYGTIAWCTSADI